MTEMSLACCFLAGTGFGVMMAPVASDELVADIVFVAGGSSFAAMVLPVAGGSLVSAMVFVAGGASVSAMAFVADGGSVTDEASVSWERAGCDRSRQPAIS